MKTLYIGSSQKDYSEICSILEKNGVKYRCAKTDRNQNTQLPGWGTARSFGGNFHNASVIYEILVDNKDYDQAQYLIKRENIQ